jgi:hypothetical protein
MPYITAQQSYQHGFTCRQTSSFLHEKMEIYPCVENEESISDMLSDKLDVQSDNGMNLENEVQSASEESSNVALESECESETSVVLIDVLEDVTVAYTFTKNVGPQFNLLPGTEPMDYFRVIPKRINYKNLVW